MPKRKVTQNTEQQYSSEFKSKVVLEYAQNPRQAKRICKENQISENLLAASPASHLS